MTRALTSPEGLTNLARRYHGIEPRHWRRTATRMATVAAIGGV